MNHQQPEVERLRAANEDVVRRFIEAINDSWNIQTMRALVTEDFLFAIPFAPDWFRVHRAVERRRSPSLIASGT